MKKILMAGMIVVSLASCKKKYNCTCTTTYLNTGASPPVEKHYVSTAGSMDVKMTKAQAQAVCDHEAQNITATEVNYWTNSGNFPSSTESYSTSCVLK